jgi:hypothetical protein
MLPRRIANAAATSATTPPPPADFAAARCCRIEARQGREQDCRRVGSNAALQERGGTEERAVEA